MAVPKYFVAIDFDKDGDFFDANEEVTSDVRVTSVHSFKISREVNLRKQRMESSVLELFLNNDDNKYSPFNPGSVLNDPATNTSVFPAPNIWFMAGYPADDFVDTDTTTLDNHTVSHDNLFSWTGDASSFSIDTNKAKVTAGGGQNVQTVLDFGESDCYVGVRFTKGSASSGLICRYIDSSNYLIVSSGTNITLDQVVAGVRTNIATSAAYSWTINQTHWILVQLHGDDIFVSIDNDLVISANDSTHNTGTKHGIGSTSSSVFDRWENFGGWAPLFFGRIDSISPRPETANQYTYIRAFDDMERLNQHQVYRVAPTAPTTAKAIIGEILDATNFDACNRILDCGQTLTHAAQHQKSMGRVALTELYQVQDDDVGLFYMDGSGYARYECSCHRASAPHSASITTWRTNRATGGQCDQYLGQRFEWDDGKERVENDVWYLYNKISDVCCVVEVWRLNDTAAILDDRPSIASGETFTTLAIGNGDVIACPITPVATTDYLVNTTEGGCGTNLTACVTSSLTAGFEGNFRLVNLTNNSGSNGFVTFLRLRAKKHTASAKAGARAENTTSQTDNGHRRIQHDSLHIDEFDTALNRAQRRVTLRARPKERLIVSMENGTKANLMQMLHRNISDRVDVVFNALSITNSFHIEGKSLTGREGGLYLNADWTLQEAFGGGWGFIKYRTTIGQEGAGQYA